MIRFFAAHPTAANILMFIILLLGIAALPSLNKETFPEIDQYQVRPLRQIADGFQRCAGRRRHATGPASQGLQRFGQPPFDADGGRIAGGACRECSADSGR